MDENGYPSAAAADAPVTMAQLMAVLLERGGMPATGYNGDKWRRSREDGQRPVREPPTVKGMSDAEVREHIKENRCYGCHTSDCDKKRCPARLKLRENKAISWPQQKN